MQWRCWGRLSVRQRRLRVKGTTSLHFAIFKNGGPKLFLDIADAVELVSRAYQGIPRAGLTYKRAGFAGLLVSEGRGKLEVIHTESVWPCHRCEWYGVEYLGERLTQRGTEYFN